MEQIRKFSKEIFLRVSTAVIVAIIMYSWKLDVLSVFKKRSVLLWKFHAEEIIIFVMMISVVLLIYEKNKKIEQDNKGLNFVKRWKKDDYQRFKFLFWFIQKNTTQSNINTYKLINEVYEIKVLLEKNVLFDEYFRNGSMCYKMPTDIFEYLKSKKTEFYEDGEFSSENFFITTENHIKIFHLEKDLITNYPLD